MRRSILCTCIVAQALLAGPACAIGLTWHGGGVNITATAAVRCTLDVRADSTEIHLPAEWRLVWCADSSGIQFSAADTSSACLDDNAQAVSLTAPTTRADSVAHVATAHFCSQGSGVASVAYQIVDLPASGSGKLKVVALLENDFGNSQAIESNEVTYNGGVEGPYPPVILRAASAHQSDRQKFV